MVGRVGGHEQRRESQPANRPSVLPLALSPPSHKLVLGRRATALRSSLTPCRLLGCRSRPVHTSGGSPRSCRVQRQGAARGRRRRAPSHSGHTPCCPNMEAQQWAATATSAKRAAWAPPPQPQQRPPSTTLRSPIASRPSRSSLWPT